MYVGVCVSGCVLYVCSGYVLSVSVLHVLGVRCVCLCVCVCVKK